MPVQIDILNHINIEEKKKITQREGNDKDTQCKK